MSRLPELPVELFELSAKLDFSQHGLVITNLPEAVTVKPPAIPTHHAVSRASHELKMYFAWLLYPHVVCTPVPDLDVMGARSLEPEEQPAPKHAADLAAIAKMRRLYKLSRFHGQDLPTPWGCEVSYGPWFGLISYVQSCYDGVPDQWSLASTVLAMQIGWEGGPNDLPSVPNLTVWWDPGHPAAVESKCCPDYIWCPASGSCLHYKINCPDPTPQ